MESMDGSKAQELVALLQKTHLFAQLDDKTALALLPHLQEMRLATGDILFQENTLAESFYILIEGALSASLTIENGQQKVVGLIHSGETVGELGALSHKPRTLTVRATVPSRLLELTREDFEKFCQAHPSVIFPLLEIIISRSQKTIRLLAPKNKTKKMILISGDGDVEFFAKFIDSFKPYLLARENIQLIEEVRDPFALMKLIELADHENKTLIFCGTKDNLNLLTAHTANIDSLYLVVNGSHLRPISTFAQSFIATINRVSLVIVHPPQTKAPKKTLAWLKKIEKTTLHHHCRFNHAEHYQRLRRHMEGRAIGLVLGGGGAKGWAALGVIKALQEKNIPLDAIGGTSVGAMIAGFYAMDPDYEEVYYKFRRLATSVGESPFHWGNLTWPIISFLSGKKPTLRLHSLCGEQRIEDLWIPFFATSCNLSTHKEVAHSRHHLWVALRASGSIPGLVPPMVIDGQIHVDGGLTNNLPTDYMRSWLGPDAFIIAVSLTKFSRRQHTYHFPPSLPFRVALLRKLHFGYQDYSFPPFMDTFLQALLIGSSTHENANKLIADLLINPDLSGYRVLRNKKNDIDKLIQLGYQDVMGNSIFLNKMVESMT